MTPTPDRDRLDRLAHDLKNPIAVIAGFAELLLLRDDEQTRREAPQRILEATAQLTASVERMLESLPHGRERPASAPLPAAPFAAGAGRVVVVADDDRLLRRLLSTMLPSDGFTVLEADDGVEALELVRREDPALLLLDLSMPRCSGVEVLTELHELRPELPVIVVSAEPGDGGRDEALALGAVAYVAKPFSPLQLLATIHNALAAD